MGLSQIPKSGVPEYERCADEELMVLYIGGDERAFQELFRRYKAKAYAYLRRRISDVKVVDDLFQTVFLNLHRSRARYKENRVFSAWLFAVCRNVVRDYLRSLKKHRAVATDEETLEAIAGEKTEGVSPETLLSDALEQVTPREREAMELRYEEALDFEEIARSMNTTSENVRQLISRGVRKIREILR